jgi:hypothetical protein
VRFRNACGQTLRSDLRFNRHVSGGKTWEKTPRQNLVWHQSGRYYARPERNGKEIWKSAQLHFAQSNETRPANPLNAVGRRLRQTV